MKIFLTFRFIVIDGNEKNYRAICSAEKTRIIGTQGDVNGYLLCTRNPTRGNQHKKPSKLCPQHDQGPAETPEAIDMRPCTRSFMKLVPNVVTSGKGCKKDEAVERYYDRTAGIFYAFRPCGIRLSH